MTDNQKPAAEKQPDEIEQYLRHALARPVFAEPGPTMASDADALVTPPPEDADLAHVLKLIDDALRYRDRVHGAGLRCPASHQFYFGWSEIDTLAVLLRARVPSAEQIEATLRSWRSATADNLDYDTLQDSEIRSIAAHLAAALAPRSPKGEKA